MNKHELTMNNIYKLTLTKMNKCCRKKLFPNAFRNVNKYIDISDEAR